MLKKFFIAMLGSMAGIWLSIFIFFIGMLITIGLLVISNAPDSPTLSAQNILHIRLTGEIPERQSEFNMQSLLNYSSDEGDNLSDILAAINLASNDKKINGIFLDCQGASLGIASRSEMLEALAKFKSSGKWIYAYADNFDQGDYYVASVADRVSLNPVGMLDVHGLASTTIFFKDVMDKLGIKVEIFKVGTFKSAVEPYMRNSMSEPSKLQTSIYLNQIWGDIVKGISQNREVEASAVNGWADSLSITWDPQSYLEKSIITNLEYREEFEQAMRDRLGLHVKNAEDDDLPLITPAAYLDTKSEVLIGEDKKHIAVLYAVGEISESGSEGIVSSKLVPVIDKLAKNDKVKGLVLRVNSPGGSAFASEQIWHALENFKDTGKPFFVSMGDYAASGGYYISCGADQIYADAATLTGSIGIFGMLPDFGGLLSDKIGLKFETVQTNPNASFPNVFKSPTTAQLAGMQKYVERGYETFTSRVAQGRDISIDSVKVIAEGRVWDGSTALELGLVDHIGSLTASIEAIAENLGMKSTDYVCYPKITNKWLDFLLDEAGLDLSVEIDGLSSEELKEVAKFVKRVKEMDPLQARMETIIIE